jgi:hypothetical protein
MRFIHHIQPESLENHNIVEHVNNNNNNNSSDRQFVLIKAEDNDLCTT